MPEGDILHDTAGDCLKVTFSMTLQATAQKRKTQKLSFDDNLADKLFD